MRGKVRVLGAVVAASALYAGAASAASAPTDTTGPAFAIQFAAQLNGSVDPHGSSTTYYFQWGLTPSYGDSTTSASAGSVSHPVLVHRTATGMTADTTYHYRIVASNQFGTAFGADRTFKTPPGPPTASTSPAENISTNGATLAGSVNPEDQSTTWYFQWGGSTKYGQQTVSQTLPKGTSPTNVSWSLAGLLSPGTVYHFRLVATHPFLTTYGADQSFMTYPSPRPVPKVRAKTKPGHARDRPYVLTTTGTVVGPSWMPAQYACAGNVTIRFFRGSTQVAYRLAHVDSQCSFSARTVFRRLPGHPKPHHSLHLKVVTRFLATPYLGPNRAADQKVKLG